MVVSRLSQMFEEGLIMTGDCATCGDNKGATVVTRVAMANMEKMNNSIAKAGAVEAVVVEVAQPAPIQQPRPKEALPLVLPTPTLKESPLAGAKERIEKNV